MGKFIKFLIIMVIFGGIAGFLEFNGYLYHNDVLAKLAGYKVQGLEQCQIKWICSRSIPFFHNDEQWRSTS